MAKTHDLQTRTVRAGLETDSQHGAVVAPIHLSSTFSFESFGVKRQYDYSRSGNPTRTALAEAIAELEGGAGAVVTDWRGGDALQSGNIIAAAPRLHAAVLAKLNA